MLSALGTVIDGAAHSGGGVPECRDRSTPNGHRTPCRRHAQAVGRGEARNVPNVHGFGERHPTAVSLSTPAGPKLGLERLSTSCAHSRYVRHPFRWLRASVLWGARSGDDVSTSILADFASGWNKIPASPRRLPARTRPASRSPREERVQPRAAVRAGPRPAPRDPDLGHGGALCKRCGVGGRIHAAAGGRPERLTTTEPRDRFLEPPQASRLRHGVEATALPHRGPPIQPRARARARAKRDRHMQPVRQDHHPGGPQALNNHLEPKARQCATRDVVGATGGGLGGEVAGEAGRAAARSIGPDG